MEATEKFDLIQAISFVYDESDDCKLDWERLQKMDPAMKVIGAYFQVSKRQALLLALVFVFNFRGDLLDSNDLSRHLDCNPARLIDHYNDLLFLAEIGILKKSHKQYGFGDLSKNSFMIHDYIRLAMIKKELMPEIKSLKCPDIVSFLGKIYSLGEERDDRIISTDELFKAMLDLVEDHLEFPLLQKVKQIDLAQPDLYMLLYLLWKTIMGNECSNLHSASDGIFDCPMTRMVYEQKIISNENELLKKGWVKVMEAKFINDTELKLTEQSLALLKDENIKLFTNLKKRENILSPENIPTKTLYYNQGELKQVSMLESMLEDKNLLSLQKRLTEKAMPNGITILLHGAPGTGKTESVYQIARKTGREIMRVEISQAKSMWFGESEKRIKKIFTDYEDFMKQSNQTPILLFNEADAIISKRKENNNSSASQTENAIQNILLEELENFKGILFATTNLANNLDKAFERRFLFKVEYFKPDTEIRAKIWKSKLLSAGMEDFRVLAERFEFSGGQIDNIVRKCEMFEVLNGKTPDLEVALEFCNEELLNKQSHNAIGFRAIS
jgi:ATP-dependent 26S proteasome regulatory subunit